MNRKEIDYWLAPGMPSITTDAATTEPVNAHHTAQDAPHEMPGAGAPAALLTLAEFDVREERARQDAQWGGPAYDDQQSLTDFLMRIADQCEKMASEKPADHRSRIVKIAALAVAALESHDRKAGMVAQQSPSVKMALRILTGEPICPKC
jgi:hypothetical protein